jgi:hypothetical protein
MSTEVSTFQSLDCVMKLISRTRDKLGNVGVEGSKILKYFFVD